MASLTWGHPTRTPCFRGSWPRALDQPGVIAAASCQVGDLAIGDPGLTAAVSAAHRSETVFAACAWLVDAVKERLPV